MAVPPARFLPDWALRGELKDSPHFFGSSSVGLWLAHRAMNVGAMMHWLNRLAVARLLTRYADMVCASVKIGLAQKYIEHNRANDFSL